MSKKEFMKKLSRALKALPAGEREKTLSYYDELIEDRREAGCTEEQAVDALGSVQGIADEIISDAVANGTRLKKGMPKALKAILIALGVLLGLGIIACAVLTVSGTFIASSQGEWRQVSETYKVDDTALIEVDYDQYCLNVEASPDEFVHVIRFENEKLLSYTVTEYAGGLRIVQKHKPFSGFLMNVYYRQTQLLLPESFAGKLDADVTTGDLTVNSVSGIELEAGATTGDVKLSSCILSNASLHCTTGDIKVENCTVGPEGDFSPAGSCGELKIKGTTALVSVTGTSAGSITVKVTTGDITLSNVTAESVTTHSTTGKLEVWKLDAQALDFTATTGEMRGSLAGAITDYTIESSVTTGRNDLPGSFAGGSRSLKAHTTTGDIRISFESNN